MKNAMFGFSTWMLPLVLSFVATPIIVTSLGHEDYGIYALILGFIGYSFNFGIGRAITKYIAEYRVEKSTEKISRMISATLTLNLGVGLAGAVIIIALSGFLTESVFMIAEDARQKTITAFFLAAMIMFLTMMNQVGSSLLQGIHRFDVYSKLFNANSIAIIVGNIALSVAGFGLLWLLGWNVAVISVTTVLGLFAARRLVPEFKFRLDFSRAAITGIFGFSAWIVGYQIMANLLLLFERGFITRKLGPEALTLYVVPMTIGIYIHSSIASLMLVVFPLASERTGDRPALERLYLKGTKLSCMIVFFVVTSIIVQNYQFLSLWMGPSFADAAWDLLILHTITFGLAAILIVAWQTVDGLGHPAYNFLIYSVSVAISLTGMVVLIDDYGNRGIAIARLAGFGALVFSILYSEKRFFGRVMSGFWLKSLSALVPAAAFAALTEHFLVSNLEPSWLVLVMSTTLGGLVYGTVLVLFGFVTDEEKALLRKALRV